ncbi:hypothetical protein [Streptomonospora arabica]
MLHLPKETGIPVMRIDEEGVHIPRAWINGFLACLTLIAALRVLL